MKNINEIKLQVLKDGKRVDRRVISYNFDHKMVVYAKADMVINYEINGEEGFEVVYGDN